ncbi:MAG: ABC transporter permease [Candidatus Competibacteraceae bacterium]|nr:ABC transporter permease [Candidatus Competibacteraceae bacterium]
MSSRPNALPLYSMSGYHSMQSSSFQTFLQMVWALAWKNIRVKYKNSILGLLWSLINPLLFLLIFSYVFGHAFPDIENYTLFALTGLVIWSIFPLATSQSAQSLIEGGPILKALAVPPIVFPISSLLASAFQFFFTLIPFAAIMAILGYQPSIHLIAIVPLLIFFFLFIAGLSLIICSVHVFFRDVGLLWNTLLPAIFYFTPIAYPPTLIPEHIRWAMQLNPVYHFISPFRMLIYEKHWPALSDWILLSTTGTLFFVVSIFVFRALQKHFISHY